jgi:hypothetical protein
MGPAAASKTTAGPLFSGPSSPSVFHGLNLAQASAQRGTRPKVFPCLQGRVLSDGSAVDGPHMAAGPLNDTELCLAVSETLAFDWRFRGVSLWLRRSD